MTCVEDRLYEDEKLVALKDLRLDPQNVRFRHITKPMNEKEMEEWLYAEEDVRVLIKQLLRDGWNQQLLYVMEDSEGHYIVKQENTTNAGVRKIRLHNIQRKSKLFETAHYDE